MNIHKHCTEELSIGIHLTVMWLYASCLIQTLACTEVLSKLIFLGLKAIALKMSSLGLFSFFYNLSTPLQIFLIRRTVLSYMG